MSDSNKKLSMSELERLSADEFREADKFPITLVLDNIRSGLNVGSIFRSADAFRVKQIICCGFTPTPPHRDILKSALGATESVAWTYVGTALEAIQSLKQAGVRCYAIEQTNNSTNLRDVELNTCSELAIVLGNEVSGVEQAVIDSCDGSIEIEQHGTKHSLNVAVCAGIVLFSLSGKFVLLK